MKVQTVSEYGKSRTDRLAKAAERAIADASTEAELKNTRLVLMVLDVPSDSATVITGNYDNRDEALTDIVLLVKALRVPG